MKMGSLIGWGIAIGGGYLLMKSLGYDPLSFISSVGAGTPVNTSTTPGTTVSTDTTTVNPSAATTLQAVVAKITADKGDPNAAATVDYWNYYYAQVRGTAGPSPESLFPSNDRNRKYYIAEWWTAMVGRGFSGMGVIAHHVNPYANILGTPFGQNITPTGFEYMRVSKGQ